MSFVKEFVDSKLLIIFFNFFIKNSNIAKVADRNLLSRQTDVYFSMFPICLFSLDSAFLIFYMRIFNWILNRIQTNEYLNTFTKLENWNYFLLFIFKRKNMECTRKIRVPHLQSFITNMEKPN